MARQLYSRSLRNYKLRYWGPWTINENSLAWLHRAAHTKQDRRAFKWRTQRAPVLNTKGHRQKTAWVDLTFGTLLCLMLLLFQGWPNSCERCSAALSWQILGNRKKKNKILRDSRRKLQASRSRCSAGENHGGGMNQRGVDQGWSCVVEGGWCRKKGACLTTNSSHPGEADGRNTALLHSPGLTTPALNYQMVN